MARSNDGGGATSGANPTSSRVAYLRQHYSDKGFSGGATNLLLSSWRQKSAQSYDSLCKRWISWCSERHSDPVSGPIEDFVNFLAELHYQGYQYRSLCAYRSAIASMHSPIDGFSVGQHPLVSRLLKGAFQLNPPLPRYSSTWDVNFVLTHLNSHRLDANLTLRQLTLRTVMLMALTRPSRSVDLSNLDLTGFRNTPEGSVFVPRALTKQSRPGREIKEFFFPKFQENSKLCPVHSLNLYIDKTRLLREEKTRLFISLIKPHNPVTSCTIARWLKQVMTAAGIDTSIFKAHSVRSASTSAASTAGVTTEDILNAADWSTESSFSRFYYKPVRNPVFASAILKATNNTIDM
uniref:Tyr recombinase domain-containing protein n=1 Tax=Amphimedon queenslandica TaxID=400682 RepID=A0A1X7VE33_AMPQE